MTASVRHKALAAIAAAADDDKFGPFGGFTAVLSTPSQDRDGERLLREDWMPLPDRLPLDADHGMTVATTIGSFHPYWDGDALMMHAQFASTEKAQAVRQLVAEGHIQSVSVAFMTHPDLKADDQPYRELLNAGVVAIPANPEAVIIDAKALDTLAKAAGAGDSALVQAIHDAAGHLGAKCIEKDCSGSYDDDDDPDSDDPYDYDDENKAARLLWLRLKALN